MTSQSAKPRTMKAIVASAGCALSGLVMFLAAGASRALAQVSGDTTEIPHNAPSNWADQFVGWPLLLLALVLIIAVGSVYALKMVRVRYPKG